MSVVYGGFFDKLRRTPASRDAPLDASTLCGAVALHLPAKSALRRWHEYPRERAGIARSLAADSAECSLVIVDMEAAADMTVTDEVETFQALAAGKEKKEDASWMLLEPMEDGRYRRWSPTTAVVLWETWRAGQRGIVNPVDPRKRPFSQDTRLLCEAITKDPKFITSTAAENARRLFRSNLARNMKKAAAGVVGVGIIACSVAAALCTGVGAIGIATSVAESIIEGGASQLGNAAAAAVVVPGRPGSGGGRAPMPNIPDEESLGDIELLRARLDRLETAVFEGKEGEATKSLADKVAEAWNQVRRPGATRKV